MNENLSPPKEILTSSEKSASLLDKSSDFLGGLYRSEDFAETIELVLDTIEETAEEVLETAEKGLTELGTKIKNAIEAGVVSATSSVKSILKPKEKGNDSE